MSCRRLATAPNTEKGSIVGGDTDPADGARLLSQQFDMIAVIQIFDSRQASTVSRSGIHVYFE